MNRSFHLAALLGAGAAIAALCLPAAAGAAQLPGPSPFGAPVFAQTNDPSGNQIVSYVQTGSGLRQVGRYDTGGLASKIRPAPDSRVFASAENPPCSGRM
jgi:hypothetical protein